MDKKNCNIQLAQKFNIESFENNFSEDFYAVPNIIGRNILILKDKKTTKMMLPNYIIGIDEKNKFFLTDEKGNESKDTENITNQCVATKVSAIIQDGSRKFIDCRFDDLLSILSEIHNFFMTDIGFQGKIVYNTYNENFWFLIYDLFTLEEFNNKKGITPYNDRRDLLNIMSVHHTFINVSIAPVFYNGNNLKACDISFERFNYLMDKADFNIKNNGYLIYNKNANYIFGQTEKVLVVSKGEGGNNGIH